MRPVTTGRSKPPAYRLFGGVRGRGRRRRGRSRWPEAAGGPGAAAARAGAHATPADRIIDAVWGERPAVTGRGVAAGLRVEPPQGVGRRPRSHHAGATAATALRGDAERRRRASGSTICVARAVRPRCAAAQLDGRADAAVGCPRASGPAGRSAPWPMTFRSVMSWRNSRRGGARPRTRSSTHAWPSVSTTSSSPISSAAVGRRSVARTPASPTRRWRCIAPARPVDALRAIEDARRTLADEVGVAPGPELVELERAILDHAAELRVAPTGARPPARARAKVGPPRRRLRRSSIASSHPAGRLARRRVARSGRAVVVSGEAGIGKIGRSWRTAAARAGPAGRHLSWRGVGAPSWRRRRRTGRGAPIAAQLARRRAR